MILDLAKEKQIRWEVLFTFYEFHLNEPRTTFIIKEVKNNLTDYDDIEISRTIGYLDDKGLLIAKEAKTFGQTTDYTARISSGGIDKIEQAVEEHEISLKKRPPGFENW